MANTVKIHQGNALDVLKTMPNESVHCVVTSPPYFGLRDYGTAAWIGGDEKCDHKGEPMRTRANINQNTGSGNDLKNQLINQFYHSVCGKCGAARADEQIGLESTPSEFVAKLVEVFAEVYRVMRHDATLWLNLGDSYAGGKGASGSQGAEHQEARNKNQRSLNRGYQTLGGKNATRPTDDRAMLRAENLKPKDLIGIPWRVAFALQDFGFYLRQDIIWSKPNPMPESVTDRCTKSHEYLFLLTKSAKYYFDNEAIKDPLAFSSVGRLAQNTAEQVGSFRANGGTKNIKAVGGESGKRNRRSVWTVTTTPFSDAHFATFPEKLIEPCILAGTSEKGCCATCGAPYVRNIEKELKPTAKASFNSQVDARDLSADKNDQGSNRSISGHKPGWFNDTKTLGWLKSCLCLTDEIKPCVVLDPFNGAATTGVVSLKNNRSYQGIELNPEYIEISNRRLANLQTRLF